MYRRYLTFIGALFFISATQAMPMTEPVHTWYAGTQYQGSVNTSGLLWKCSGGTCTLKGPYGTGLNMAVCQELASKVGHLDYYYNDAGMTWSNTENSSLLAQCNSAAR
ncbi:hypothetical protein BAC3_02101 [uncultured bacterium]|nr:hypothetical protein BAC3_02101 [uncultured bacterium]